MTAKVRITQADMDRVMKAVKAAGITKCRVIMHLERAEIELIIGYAPSASYDPNEWTGDDV
jgi:predicted urease superfamily metal-dependent hydrolase